MDNDNKTPDQIEAAIVALQSAVASVDSKKKMLFTVSDTEEATLAKGGYESSSPISPLLAAIKSASGSASRKAPRLAFTENPAPSDNYLGLFKSKRRLVPDEILKQIRVTDHLIAAILRARGNMMSLFGHPRKNRFDIGMEIAIKQEFEKVFTPEQLAKVRMRIKNLEAVLVNCGHTEGLEQQDRTTLADFIDIQARNGLTFGRFATEIIYDRGEEPGSDGRFPFFRFRALDVATIYRAVRKGEMLGNTLRLTAIKALQSLTGENFKIDFDRLQEDEYAWLQVIEGTPRQAFTHDEMIVYNLYDSTDIEHNGYPVSPMDTAISSITTHISIDAYKKLYFQNGRASKGMLVIKSDEVDQATLDNMKLQFNASINSVSNSFRTPIFGIGKEDQVDWLAMNEGARDDDFQFMYDQIARNILSAFNMSPDELPGYSHLSRGTNSQTLSESNNEFKLTAARDTGLRPLILKFQTFFNEKLLPLIDPLLAKIAEVRFAGIDAQSKEQESTRLQQDMAVHMNYDQTLKEVDKEPIGHTLGGEFPFNERWQIIIDKYMNVSELRAQFFKDPTAYVDPLLQYKRDPFFLQNLQLLAQVNPLALKAFYATKPFALEFLKMNIEDALEEDENVGT